VTFGDPDPKVFYRVNPMNNHINDQQSAPTVIFLHLPKAAGTTLKDILHREYQEDLIYELDGTQFIQAQEEFKQLDQAEKAEIKILMGHMYFGLHEFLPSPAKYITMLRNPIDRVVSYYHFVKKLSTHHDYELINENNISINDYCRLGRENMRNGQTRFLSNTKEFETCTQASLSEAKQNLRQHFAVVGIQERFNESLLLLQKKLGWKRMPFYYQRNTNRGNSYNQLEISPDTLATIKKYNQLDLELYEYANQIFEQELSQYNLNPGLFKLTNQLYGKYSVFAKKLLSR
jgi:hypothetical protein